MNVKKNVRFSSKKEVFFKRSTLTAALWQKSLKMQNFTTETQLFCNKLYLIFEFWSFVFYCKYFVRGNTIILYICDFFLQLYNFSNYCKKNTKVLHFQKYFVLYAYSKNLNAWFSHCGWKGRVAYWSEVQTFRPEWEIVGPSPEVGRKSLHKDDTYVIAILLQKYAKKYF